MIDRIRDGSIQDFLSPQPASQPILPRQDLVEPIAADLKVVESIIQSAVQRSDSAVKSLLDNAGLSGGKRLRPTLLLLAEQASRQDAVHVEQSATRQNSSRRSGPIVPPVRRDAHLAAAAVELVHLASLLHDDVSDGATTRRNEPTVGAEHGTVNAILAGDYLFTQAYALAAECKTSAPARRIARAAMKLCTGEIRQQASAGRWDLPLQEYLSFLKQKTGALCSVSCLLGAHVVGANPQAQRQIATFGMRVGLAFQIYDDWLDYWGTSAVGKTLGTDLAQSKPTYPVLYALAKLGRKRAEQLLNELQSRDDGSKLERVTIMLEEAEAGEATKRYAERLVKTSLEDLSVLPAGSARDRLWAVAQFAVHRQT